MPENSKSKNRDVDFWKREYQEEWDESSAREAEFAKTIGRMTGRDVEFVGLGAGSTEFISGSARDHGGYAGDADLRVKDTDIYIEVTGPLRVNPNCINRVNGWSLWVRPDKLRNARARLGEHDTFIAHNVKPTGLWRVIHLDQEFFDRYDAGYYSCDEHNIRGNVETYVSIPARDVKVEPVSHLYDYIKKACA